MRFLMTLGGLIGFLLGVGLGLSQGGTWPGILWRASVAALAGGVLLRWWGRVLITSVKQARLEQAVARMKTAAKPAAGPAKV